MSFQAELDKFDGPLDLMLHLIREQKLDIMDLDMDILTEQYLNYLNKLEELNLEVESEYLVELSVLIEYKAKKLLPKEKISLEGEYEEDPKDRLVKRLLEYQRYKQASMNLYDNYLQRSDQYAKSLSSYEMFKKEEVENNFEGNPNDLLKAMNKLLRRLQLSKPLETKYTEKEISVDERSLEIKAKLMHLPEVFNFEELVKDCKNVHLFVVTFLAVLDLARNQILQFNVDQNENIWLRRYSNV